MNLILLSWNYIRSKPLNTVLNVMLLSLGLAIILVIMLISYQLQDRITRNAKGVNLVVGAKGSPLQLILCNVYHIDFPTGNIPLKSAIGLSRNSLIKKSIPLALGDSYKGVRLVGSTPDYVNLYEAKVGSGEIWDEKLEAVLGFQAAQQLQLKIGDEFQSEHGMSSGGMEHDGEQPFKVVGILEPSETVLDNLILTSIESIWEMHSHEKEDHDHHHESDSMVTELGITFPLEHLEEKEITAMIIQYAGPMGAVQLPRLINKNTNMQAASPAFETARLFTLIGVGVEVVNGFAYLIMLIATLSIFIALYNSLKERKYDLAIMRSMGASRKLLFVHITLEGLIITFFGGLAGILVSHSAVEIIGKFVLSSGSQAGVTGFVFLNDELIVIAISFVVGIIASIIPAINAYKTDISKVLAEG